ncbi:glycerate kinase [Oceanobacillus salinisoli]|uniref:glycerate kinase n=1 Tax=Oceanobacillus salinisoli TaxID=2678611 RepID=UPI0012E2E9E8|nr:glycerate kinase [Oceanobacillus salinisoli]
MKVVVAPDSFKGSLTSIEAANRMKEAILQDFPEADVMEKPMADGGEGTLAALLKANGGKEISVSCKGPLGESIQTTYGMVNQTTAIIEVASIAGLTQVPEEKRNPDNTTSYGIGEVMLDAMSRGCTEMIVGLGGSATNDGGHGMLQAIGMKAWNKEGKEVEPFGKNVQYIDRVDFSEMDSRFKHVSIKVASDVDNPLCGENGATAVYGPQKGMLKERIPIYDQALDTFSDLIEAELHKSIKNYPGAGAAGGLGFAFLTLGAKLVSGAQLVGEAMEMESTIQQADFVITGEGKSDEQTLYGKAPGYVASLAEKYDVPVVLISGSIDGDIDQLMKKFSGCFSIVTKPITLKECMEKAGELLYQQTKQVIHFIRSVT